MFDKVSSPAVSESRSLTETAAALQPGDLLQSVYKNLRVHPAGMDQSQDAVEKKTSTQRNNSESHIFTREEQTCKEGSSLSSRLDSS